MGYCKSFNSKLRDELLAREIFYDLREAKALIEDWRIHYNIYRPHSSLGYKPQATVTAVPASFIQRKGGMTPLETEADPNIRVGPLRWGRPAPSRDTAVVQQADWGMLSEGEQDNNRSYKKRTDRHRDTGATSFNRSDWPHRESIV